MTRSNDRSVAGSGTIELLPSGQYRGRVDLGIDPATGKRVRRSITRPTRREVQAEMNRLKAEADAAVAPPTTSTRKTVQDAWDAYLAALDTSVAAGRRSQATRDYYAGMYSRIQPLAERPLLALTALDVQRWLQTVPGAPSTRRGALLALRGAIDAGMRLGWVTRNVAKGVEAPAPTPEREIVHATADDVAALVANAPEPYATAILLLAHTGMRSGEALDLRWADVDLDSEQLYVRSGKTARARRTVPLTPTVVARLRALPRDAEYVFPNRAGGRTDKRRFSRIFAAASPRPGLTPHSLRHGAATRMLAAGVPVHIVSALLGHASVSVTLDVYSHSLTDAERESVRLLDN